MRARYADDPLMAHLRSLADDDAPAMLAVLARDLRSAAARAPAHKSRVYLEYAERFDAGEETPQDLMRAVAKILDRRPENREDGGVLFAACDIADLLTNTFTLGGAA
jgi:hypothetical protein